MITFKDIFKNLFNERLTTINEILFKNNSIKNKIYQLNLELTQMEMDLKIVDLEKYKKLKKLFIETIFTINKTIIENLENINKILNE